MHGEYTIAEFISRLAAVEEKFSDELRSVTECFYQSRLDLPAKKLDEIGRVRLRAAKQLRKIDRKKSDPINLWKLCNVYSACAVDTDNAMREIRKCLRKIIVKSEKIEEKEREKEAKGKEKNKAKEMEYNLVINGNVITPMRRLGDDYRPENFVQSAPPANARQSRSLSKSLRPKDAPPPRPPLPARAPSMAQTIDLPPEPEIYDKHKPTPEEAQRTLALWRQSIDGSSMPPLRISAPPPETKPKLTKAVSSVSKVPPPTQQSEPRADPPPEPKAAVEAIQRPLSLASLKTTTTAEPNSNQPPKCFNPVEPNQEKKEKPQPEPRKSRLERGATVREIPQTETRPSSTRSAEKHRSPGTRRPAVSEETKQSANAAQPAPVTVTTRINFEPKRNSEMPLIQSTNAAAPKSTSIERSQTLGPNSESRRPMAPRKPQIMLPESTPARQMLRATYVTQDPIKDYQKLLRSKCADLNESAESNAETMIMKL